MHEPMRRKRQLLSDEEAVAILDAATAGVLAITGEDGYPYAVPLSFAHEDGSLFFHSSKAGHKLDAIAYSDKASFCVIADDKVIQETFTTHYRSAIAFGRISVLTDDDRKRHALRLLAEKYSPDYLDAADDETRWQLESHMRTRADDRGDDRQGRNRDHQAARPAGPGRRVEHQTAPICPWDVPNVLGMSGGPCRSWFSLPCAVRSMPLLARPQTLGAVSPNVTRSRRRAPTQRRRRVGALPGARADESIPSHRSSEKTPA